MFRMNSCPFPLLLLFFRLLLMLTLLLSFASTLHSPPPSSSLSHSSLPSAPSSSLASFPYSVSGSNFASSPPSPSSASSSYLSSNIDVNEPAVFAHAKSKSPVTLTGIDLEEYENLEHDYAVWSAISQSMSEWRERRKRKQEETKTGAKVRRRREDNIAPSHFDTPASEEAINTTFLLYTRKNRDNAQILDYNNQSSLLDSNFNTTAQVKVIIHGFGSSSRRPWVQQMTAALLDLDDFNVINVDWENGSRMPNYVQAASNTQLIGEQLAKLIRMIHDVTRTPPSHYHLIGFSLGAHVAGMAGSKLRDPNEPRLPGNISRITGLDPASPLFEGYPTDVRLDPSDAEFVDVIHSNGDSFIKGGLGSYSPMGHVDFYPNGGRVQVGCNSVIMGAISDIIYGKWNSLCNHRRAFRFFIDSMSPSCTFRAFACDTYENYAKGSCFSCGADGAQCSNMGYWAHKSPGRGNMYLITREQEPFCANDYRLRLESGTEGQGATWGRVEVALVTADGQNETFVLSSEGEELKEGAPVQTLVVAHPQLLNISQVQITYVKYKGWIYNGKAEWPVDRFELLNAHGNVKSYCARGTKLTTGQPTRLYLSPGNCTTLNTGINSNNMSQTMIETNEVSINVQAGNGPNSVGGYRKPTYVKHTSDGEEMSVLPNQIAGAGEQDLGNNNSNAGGGMSNMFWKFIGLDTTTTSSVASGPEVSEANDGPQRQPSGGNRPLVLPVFELTENGHVTETSDAIATASSGEGRNGGYDDGLLNGGGVGSGGGGSSKQLSPTSAGDDEGLFRSSEPNEDQLNNDRDLHETAKHLRTFGKSAKETFHRASFGPFGRRPSIVGLIRTSRASKYGITPTDHSSSSLQHPHAHAHGHSHPQSVRWTSRASNFVRNRTAQFFMKFVHSPPSPSSPIASSLASSPPASVTGTKSQPLASSMLTLPVSSHPHDNPNLYEANTLSLAGSLPDDAIQQGSDNSPSVSASLQPTSGPASQPTSAYWLLSTTNGSPIVLESTKSSPPNIIDHFQASPFSIASSAVAAAAPSHPLPPGTNPIVAAAAVLQQQQQQLQHQHQQHSAAAAAAHQYLHNQRSLPVNGVSFGPYYESSAMSSN